MTIDGQEISEIKFPKDGGRPTPEMLYNSYWARDTERMVSDLKTRHFICDELLQGTPPPEEFSKDVIRILSMVYGENENKGKFQTRLCKVVLVNGRSRLRCEKGPYLASSQIRTM